MNTQISISCLAITAGREIPDQKNMALRENLSVT